MRKTINIIFAVLLVFFYITGSHAQTFIPAARFYYDANGNRILRKMGEICIGVDCPIESSIPPFKGAPKDSSKNSGVYGTTEIEAYPNPVSQELYIDNRTWQEGNKANIAVFDINGKINIKREFTQAKNNVSFRDLTPGVYLVQYYLNGMPMQEWKIIKL